MGEWIVNNIEWIAALFITILFSALNVVIAVCTLRVTKQQTKMQNDSFCYQLFEKRMTIYESIDKVLGHIFQRGKVDTNDIIDFNYARKDVKFLFDSDICESYDTILKTIQRIHILEIYIEEDINSKTKTDDHSQMCEGAKEKWLLLMHQTEEMSEKIKKYISFAEYKIEKD